MSDPQTGCLSDEIVFDYWTSDADASTRARVEAHMFDCAACAARIGDADAFVRALRALVRQGRIRSFVTDETLNRLAHDGARMRGYTVDAGATLHCAVWEEDEVVVTRLRADLSEVTAVDVTMRLDGGEVLERTRDVPVAVGARDLVMMLPASVVRQMPMAPVRLTLTDPADTERRVIAEYVFDHQGVGICDL